MVDSRKLYTTIGVPGGQDPEEFFDNVTELCQNLWGRPHAEFFEGSFEIKWMGLALSSSDYFWIGVRPPKDGKTYTNSHNLPQEGQFILRLPRRALSEWEYMQLVLRQKVGGEMGKLAGFLVPQVICGDWTEENRIGRPYMIQTHVPGVTYGSVEGRNSEMQNRRIAADLGTIFRAISSFSNHSVGIPSLEVDGPSISTRVAKGNVFTIDSWHESDCGDSALPTLVGIGKFIRDRLQRWKRNAKRQDGPGAIETVEMCSAGLDILNTVMGLGEPAALEPHARFFLCILEDGVVADNILVTKRGEHQRISAILDWTECCYAPAAVAFRPPEPGVFWDSNEVVPFSTRIKFEDGTEYTADYEIEDDTVNKAYKKREQLIESEGILRCNSGIDLADSPYSHLGQPNPPHWQPYFDAWLMGIGWVARSAILAKEAPTMAELFFAASYGLKDEDVGDYWLREALDSADTAGI